MTCVVCYATKRGHARWVRCITCVARWCGSCHDQMVEAFVRSTFENIDHLDVRDHGLSCPCCRGAMNSSAVHVYGPGKAYLRHYVDGIYQFGHEVLLLDRTRQWLQQNATWVSATGELDRLRGQVERLGRIIGELEELIDVGRTLLVPKPPDDGACPGSGVIERLRAQCTELRRIKDSKILEIGRVALSIPALFARRHRSDPTSTQTPPTSTSTALRSFEATRNDDARYDGQFDGLFEPITFYTMLPMRVERILNLTSPSEHLLSVIHLCRTRSIVLDLAHDLQASCRPTRRGGRTGVRRWLLRTELHACPVDAHWQRLFMRCVSRMAQVDGCVVL